MQFADTKLGRRLARMDWRWRGTVHGKKGPTENRYSLRARQLLARRPPGGNRWKRLKELGNEF